MSHAEFESGWQYNEPDMVIGSKNKMKGDIKFEGVLRIDGSLEGNIIAPYESKVIISSTGMFVGDLVGLSGAFIDGKIIGDVNVESVHLGSSAAVHGDVTCRSLQMDGGAAVVGRLEVSPRTFINSDYDETKSIIEGDVDNETDGASLGSPSPAKPELPYEEEQEPSPVKPPPKKNYRTVLFIMEPQVDFYPGGKCGGKAPNEEDQQAADRMAEFIYSHIDDIDDIVITLDSHNRIHVAHGAFWVDKRGNAPLPNTLITMQDLHAGLWRPRKEESLDYCIAILQQLEANQQLYGHRSANAGGEGGIVIKPDHCLVGSHGAAILPALHEAVSDWTAHRLRNVTYLTRDLTHEGGGHQHLNRAFSTSAGSGAQHARAHQQHQHLHLHAADEVQVIGGGANGVHRHDYYDLSFLAALNEEDVLYICGQSHSLCVEFSLKDVLESAATTGNIRPSNIFILKEATSTAALVSSDDDANRAPDEDYGVGGGQSERADVLVEEFWDALSRTGVEIVGNMNAI